MAFIGEDRLLVAEDLEGPHQAGTASKLVLLDVSGMVEPLAAVREVRFVCNPRYCGTRVRLMAEGAGHGDFSQVIGPDLPFHPDPSRRVLVLTFSPRGGAYGAVLGICVVHSETMLRLAREKGEGVVEWDVWGKYTVAPDTGDVPGADGFPRYSVSGSRFARVYVNETEKWAKVRLYDLSHWSLRQLDVGLDECEESNKKVGFRLIEGVLELPQSMWNICHAAMLQDSLIFFSVGSYTLLLWVQYWLTDAFDSLTKNTPGGIPKQREP